MKPGSCTLCGGSDVELFYEDWSKQYRSSYFTCNNCHLIFAPEEFRPSLQREFERYEEHVNDPEDERYREFLGQLFEPLSKRLPPNCEGLDFGSGPGPTLHLMFEEQGHEMNIYDPFYADDPSVLEQNYDFITTTEVAEHLHQPREEFNRLWRCLQPGGYLSIMTKFVRKDRSFFADWHYRLDYTHVTFYSHITLRWLADHWNATLTLFGNNVAIFRKTGQT